MGETPDRNTPPLRADGSYRMRRGPNWGLLMGWSVTMVVLVAVVLGARSCVRAGEESPPAAAPAAASQSTTASADTDPSDIAYLTILQQRGVNYGNPSSAIDAAHTTCEFLERGGTMTQAGLVAVQSGYSPADAGTIVGAATGAYCPQYGG